MSYKDIKICVFGLGYVGLPLALEFSKKYKVVAYDKKKLRINQLKKDKDYNNETDKNLFKSVKKNITFSNNPSDISICNYFIVTVPTPIKKNKKPDLSFLKASCLMIAKYINKNDIIIFESTVYPGMTEEFCIPIIEKNSSLIFNIDFFAGYSPERINPGDKKHTLSNIKKITSGSTPKIANKIDRLYSSIIKAGTFKAKSIKVAEAAKVIENTQRDLNIAFVNELSIIFDKLQIDTYDILKAASTKWNFLNFKPGLVGGHCIGVDPYYLTYKSIKSGYNPKVILSGREINDSMSVFIGNKILKSAPLINKKIKDLKVLIFGLTFKENCSDIRNSKVFELCNFFTSKKISTDVYDPHVNSLGDNYDFDLIKKIKFTNYDIIIVAVPHDIFIKMGINKIKKFANKDHIFFDIKNIFNVDKNKLNLSL